MLGVGTRNSCAVRGRKERCKPCRLWRPSLDSRDVRMHRKRPEKIKIHQVQELHVGVVCCTAPRRPLHPGPRVDVVVIHRVLVLVPPCSAGTVRWDDFSRRSGVRAEHPDIVVVVIHGVLVHRAALLGGHSSAGRRLRRVGVRLGRAASRTVLGGGRGRLVPRPVAMHGACEDGAPEKRGPPCFTHKQPQRDQRPEQAVAVAILVAEHTITGTGLKCEVNQLTTENRRLTLKNEKEIFSQEQ
ncbi:Thiazole synthase [Frankliniella fusca]|uniref:Thiazole synthase n=1 Tax=Frankliniella fusca TaxID=407009 RepID=A0AAE1HM66_9NEOP|nr:Thiazole synthase [Frankliniella fusca]